MTLAEDMDAQVTVLQSAGINATADPLVAVQASGVIVLVEPPTRDYVAREQTWQLTVLLNTTDLGIGTTKALGEVLEDLEGAVPLVSARPGARRLQTGTSPVPAYICTFTGP